MSRLAQQTQSEEPQSASIPPAEAFSTTLLAIMGRRRVVALLSEADAERADLLLRLGRHMEAEGALVMRALARPDDTVETLVEAGARDILDRRTPPADFDAVVDAVADRLELAGTGLLIVDEAHRLTEDALRDLHELAASVSPTGRFLQVLLAGRPPLAERLAAGSGAGGRGGVVEIHMAMPGLHPDPVPAVPRRLTAGPTQAAGDRRLPPARAPQPERWLAVLILLVLVGGAVALVGWPSLRDAGLQIWAETTRSLGLQAEAPPAPPPAPPVVAERLVQPPPPAIAPPPSTTTAAPPPAPMPPPQPPAAELQPAPAPVPAPAPEIAAAPPAPAPRAEPPAAAGSSGSTQVALRTIATLTTRAQRQIENNRLTTPAGDNALETVAALERAAAAAPQVDEIRDAIVLSYLRLGKQAEQRDQLAIARTYYRRGLQARPGHPALSQRLRSLLRSEEAPRAEPRETPELPPASYPDDTPTLR